MLVPKQAVPIHSALAVGLADELQPFFIRFREVSGIRCSPGSEKNIDNIPESLDDSRVQCAAVLPSLQINIGSVL